MVSRVNFLETTPERMDDVARVMREVVERYEVLFYDVPS
jgi:hypothetical protein